jgi:protease IV
MSLEVDQLIDRRRLKRRLALWRIVGIVGIVAVTVVLTARFAPWTGRDYVAYLDVEGIILADRDRDDVLAVIADDEAAKALIVYLNTPGGSVVGGETLFGGLRAIAEKKPVVAVMGDVAASAGYMTALGADRIFARAGSLTGSIGVIMQSADITGLLEKIGIKPETVKSAPLKAQPNPMEPFSQEAREVTRKVVLDVYELFVGMVEERRGLGREEALALSDGRIFTGRQALEMGLIDELGGENEARQWLSESRDVALSLPMRHVEVSRDDGLWRQLLDSSLGKTVFSERLRLDGLISLWHPDSH